MPHHCGPSPEKTKTGAALLEASPAITAGFGSPATKLSSCLSKLFRVNHIQYKDDEKNVNGAWLLHSANCQSVGFVIRQQGLR